MSKAYLMKIFLIVCYLIMNYGFILAQEGTAPLYRNYQLTQPILSPNEDALKPTSNTLPFFEDFTDYGPYPSALKWEDNLVYINNTMALNPVSRGVATFDALNDKGVPYDTVSPFHQIQADSLTSLPFDLSVYQSSDSLYLSFFYQPGGLGFTPRTSDSLMLFFRKNTGEWTKVWSMQGGTSQSFNQAFLALTDTSWFHDNFQFRFINKATKGISNSHWHLDYIRFDINRSYTNLGVFDIAFTNQPGRPLNDFTAMPFRHFITQPDLFLNNELSATILNNGNENKSILYGYTAKTNTGLSLGSENGELTYLAGEEKAIFLPTYPAHAFNPSDPNQKYVFEHQFFLESSYANESKENDTIVSKLIFDNYFAYDDGTAERSYFLNMNPNIPGKIAVEYYIYTPDTLRGVAINFAREVPSAYHKEFYLVVYKDIAINGGSEEIIYQEEYLYPTYEDSIDQFSIYPFSKPVVMEEGRFYLGIIQPAGGFSDSLFIALDRNRNDNNYRYYNVENTWLPSLEDGVLLFRPIVGREIPATVATQKKTSLKWTLYPNPVSGSLLQITIEDESIGQSYEYALCDLQGKTLMKGILKNNSTIDVSALQSGLYIISIKNNKGYYAAKKVIKL